MPYIAGPSQTRVQDPLDAHNYLSHRLIPHAGRLYWPVSYKMVRMSIVAIVATATFKLASAAAFPPYYALTPNSNGSQRVGWGGVRSGPGHGGPGCSPGSSSKHPLNPPVYTVTNPVYCASELWRWHLLLALVLFFSFCPTVPTCRLIFLLVSRSCDGGCC